MEGSSVVNNFPFSSSGIPGGNQMNSNMHMKRMYSPNQLLSQMAQPSQQQNLTHSLTKETIYQLIEDLSSIDSQKREVALIELSKSREHIPDLPILLWHSFGTIAALLQEITSIYPYITPESLTASQSNRVCNALALFQCVASCAAVRRFFLEAYIPLFLYPFLHTITTSKPFEYLRLTSLGVIGALVKADDTEVIHFLLNTEIIPLCLRIMAGGSFLSKTVATFVMQKILLDDRGLTYVCSTYDRFSHVSSILKGMVQDLLHDPGNRLFRHVVRCFLRLSDNPRACEALKTVLPRELRDPPLAFKRILAEDNNAALSLQQLMLNLDKMTLQSSTIGQQNGSLTSGALTMQSSASQSSHAGTPPASLIGTPTFNSPMQSSFK